MIKIIPNTDTDLLLDVSSGSEEAYEILKRQFEEVTMAASAADCVYPRQIKIKSAITRQIKAWLGKYTRINLE